MEFFSYIERNKTNAFSSAKYYFCIKRSNIFTSYFIITKLLTAFLRAKLLKNLLRKHMHIVLKASKLIVRKKGNFKKKQTFLKLGIQSDLRFLQFIALIIFTQNHVFNDSFHMLWAIINCEIFTWIPIKKTAFINLKNSIFFLTIETKTVVPFCN